MVRVPGPPHSVPVPSELSLRGVPAERAQSTIFDLIDCDPEYYSSLSTVVLDAAAERAAERLRTIARLR